MAEQRATNDLATMDSIATLQQGFVNGEPSAAPRRAGDHVYVLRDGVWTDAAFRSELPVVKVKAYTAGYFALLAALPELRAPFALGDRVLAAGRRVAVQVGPDGVDRLGEAALDRLRADW